MRAVLVDASGQPAGHPKKRAGMLAAARSRSCEDIREFQRFTKKAECRSRKKSRPLSGGGEGREQKTLKKAGKAGRAFKKLKIFRTIPGEYCGGRKRFSLRFNLVAARCSLAVGSLPQDDRSRLICIYEGGFLESMPRIYGCAPMRAGASSVTLLGGGINAGAAEAWLQQELPPALPGGAAAVTGDVAFHQRGSIRDMIAGYD